MAKRINRVDILENLDKQIKENKAILMFGAGTGLTAKCAEMGGADLIGIYSTALYRMRGLPSILGWLPYGNVNEDLLTLSKETLHAVKKTPIIAGVGAHDPTLDTEKFLDQLGNLGVSGITNEPFSGLYGEYFSQQLENSGLGFSKEVELIKIAKEKEFLTVAWCMSSKEAERMAKAGADIIGIMIGVTSGGISGNISAPSLKESISSINEMIEAARVINEDIIFLTHGGPINDVESARLSIQKTKAHGYASGSSGERIPTEKAVQKITMAYKKIEIESGEKN